jgi:hypothetical protein
MTFIQKEIQYLLVSIAIGLCCVLTIKSYRALKLILSVRKISLKSLSRDFGQKMWITLGLGSFFFSLYFVTVFICSEILTPEIGASLFFSAYKNPVEYIYMALFLFAFFSLLIYLLRMCIKHLYLTRSKEP